MGKLIKIQKISINMEIAAETYEIALVQLEHLILLGNDVVDHIWAGNSIYMGEDIREE